MSGAAIAAPDRGPESGRYLDGGVNVKVGPGLQLELTFADGRSYAWTPEPEGAAWLGGQLLRRALVIKHGAEAAAVELARLSEGGRNG